MNPGSERLCAACGQRIPPSAKLTAQAVTPEQLTALGVAASDEARTEPARAELCLQCRIRLAQLGVRS